MTDTQKGSAQLSSDASSSPNTLNALIIDALPNELPNHELAEPG
ncbi:hypothetical protein [Rhodococcus erythropolis]